MQSVNICSINSYIFVGLKKGADPGCPEVTLARYRLGTTSLIMALYLLLLFMHILCELSLFVSASFGDS